jgi:hypothetical protein
MQELDMVKTGCECTTHCAHGVYEIVDGERLVVRIGEEKLLDYKLTKGKTFKIHIRVTLEESCRED